MAVIILSTISTLVLAQPFKPIDEAAKHPDFLKFRNQLKTIVATRDAKALLAVVDKNIQMSYGLENGIVNFNKAWELDDPKSSFWNEMSTVLSLGGQFEGESEFQAPYVFSAWPEGTDNLDNVAIIGNKVRIRAEPNLSSPVLGTASYEILPLAIGHNNQDDWVGVQMKEGKIGYIAKQYVRNPIDYRAIFKKNKGQWKITTFINSD